MQTIKTDFDSGTLVVYIEKDIDHHNATAIRKEIDDEIGRYRPKQAILNFDAVAFMDSSGIGLIMGRYKLMQQSGGELSVTAMNPRCKKLVEISGITQLVKIV